MSAAVMPPMPAPKTKRSTSWSKRLGIAPSDDPFVGDAAAIHFVVQSDHRRAREVPCQPGARGATAHDLASEERVQVEHGVDLRRRGIGPTMAERAEAALHL